MRLSDRTARVETCLAIIREVERQGRYHLVATGEIMLAEAERLLTVEHDDMARLVRSGDAS